MKSFVYLLLLLPLTLRAQLYENVMHGFALRYADDVWKLKEKPERSTGVVRFTASRKKAAEAAVTVSVLPVPESEKTWDMAELREQYLLANQKQWETANYQLVAVQDWQSGINEGIIFDYYYHVPLAGRIHTVALMVRRGNQYYRIVYSSTDEPDVVFRSSGVALLTSLVFRNSAQEAYSPPYTSTYSQPASQNQANDLSTTAVTLQNSSVFGSTLALATGLSGNVYHLPEQTVRLPDFTTIRPIGTIYTSTIDIPDREWSQGFPGLTDRFEWFGIEYKGIVRPRQAGLYTFRLSSDDGAKLFIDGKLIIDNDGIHSASSRDGQVRLNEAEHSIRLQYFQGPRYHINLQLFVKTENTIEEIFPGTLFILGRTPQLPPAPSLQALWRGRILDDSTRQPLPRAQLRPAASEPAIAVDAAAAFSWRGEPGRSYAYEVQLPGYYTLHDNWTTTAVGRTQDILLKKVRVGSSFLLENVQFQQGKAVMLPGAELALRKLVTLLNEQPTMTIELEGHTDNVGPADKNQQLSQDRVETVKAYLVRQGVTATRISGRGYGGTRPKASNTQETTRKLNRRVEFTITGLN